MKESAEGQDDQRRFDKAWVESTQHAYLLNRYTYVFQYGPSCCEEREDEQKDNPVTESSEGQGDQRTRGEASVESTRRVHPSVTYGF